ncbi:hypothetical protein GCM10022403_079460 [Streptomyces coacervatus]|uniref:Uncharacterized protein n=1 Tax=Streptomyces coacervatus TaxID=647381 RepID=A0ABP7J673_9ACTN
MRSLRGTAARRESGHAGQQGRDEEHRRRQDAGGLRAAPSQGATPPADGGPTQRRAPSHGETSWRARSPSSFFTGTARAGEDSDAQKAGPGGGEAGWGLGSGSGRPRQAPVRNQSATCSVVGRLASRP